ncbi:hypothetical protein PR048_009556 [Dryococelus australis]|uniref:HTH psq-type domain-containing protein n=1 Tax=Dryococelus australis TaxID=614101 RepID=A0ABQ9I195_9NEOP|nr:hypothetical protein PR048_009556 [Dryococelus australis]
MPRTYYKKGVRVTYDTTCMLEAAVDVRRGLTLFEAAKQYEVPFGTICKHYKQGTDITLGGGRNPELSDDERGFAEYLRICALDGECPQEKETLQLLAEFVNQE